MMTQPAGRERRGPADALADAGRGGGLERFFALSNDMLCLADFNGFLTRVNPAFQRVFGHSSEELLREPWISFVHPDDRDATLAEFSVVLNGGESLAFENRWRSRDGSYRWLQWATATDRDACLIYAVARDVTEAKQAAAKMQMLLAEQAALRRVATLVAREGEHAEVFAVVAEEAGRLLTADAAGIVRYEPDGRGSIVGVWTAPGAPPVPTDAVVELDTETAVGRVYRTGRARRSGNFEAPRDRWRPRSDNSDINRASPHLSTWRAACGGRSVSRPSAENCCLTIRSGDSRALPSSWLKRSPTPTRANSSPPLARALYRQATQSGGGSSATSTTARSSG
jgi:PAS domain S-box-containing protein